MTCTACQVHFSLQQFVPMMRKFCRGGCVLASADDFYTVVEIVRVRLFYLTQAFGLCQPYEMYNPVSDPRLERQDAMIAKLQSIALGVNWIEAREIPKNVRYS